MTNYTEEQKQEALERFSEVGPNAASRELDIPVSTIGTWAKDAGRTFDTQKTAKAVEAHALKWAQRRALLVDRIGEVAEKTLERIESNLFETEEVRVAGYGENAIYETRYTGKSAREYATTMAILIDKAQLLSGNATSINATIGRSEAAERLAELDELANRRKEKTAA